MAETLIKVDLSKPAPSNENVHNRWHPDVPMTCWVNPGDEFILETYDWTGGFIQNNDSADDVRDIDLTTVHYLSGPVGVQGAEPGDLLVVHSGKVDVAHVVRTVVVLDVAAGPVVGLEDEVVAWLDPHGNRDVRVPAVVHQRVAWGGLGQINFDEGVSHGDAP
jgi:acetamidase/formamidase